MVVEAELIAAAAEALSKLGFDDFTIRLNHRHLLVGLLNAAGIHEEDHEVTLIAIDKLDKVGQEGVEQELRERVKAIRSLNSARILLDFFSDLNTLEKPAEIALGEDVDLKQHAINEAILGRLVEFMSNDELGAKGLDEIRSILNFTGAGGIGARLRIDPRLARGLSYYTGAIMEVNVKDLGGSLGGGGRYDNLVGMFLGQDVPACGFSLGLERIIVVMSERKMFPSLIHTPADIMVAIPDADSISDALALAAELRRDRKRVDVYPEPDKLKKQFKYAANRGIPEVAIVGSAERQHEVLSVKDMETGNQRHERRLSWKRGIFLRFLESTSVDIEVASIKISDVLGVDFTYEIEGRVRFFKLIEIVDENVARTYNLSLRTMQPSGGSYSQEEALLKVFRSRASKPPSVEKVELVAYYDKQYPPVDDPELIPRTIGRIAEFMIDSGHWAKLWIYDTWNQNVIWAYPNH